MSSRRQRLQIQAQRDRLRLNITSSLRSTRLLNLKLTSQITLIVRLALRIHRTFGQLRRMKIRHDIKTMYNPIPHIRRTTHNRKNTILRHPIIAGNSIPSLLIDKLSKNYRNILQHDNLLIMNRRTNRRIISSITTANFINNH